MIGRNPPNMMTGGEGRERLAREDWRTDRRTSTGHHGRDMVIVTCHSMYSHLGKTMTLYPATDIVTIHLVVPHCTGPPPLGIVASCCVHRMWQSAMSVQIIFLFCFTVTVGACIEIVGDAAVWRDEGTLWPAP